MCSGFSEFVMGAGKLNKESKKMKKKKLIEIRKKADGETRPEVRDTGARQERSYGK